MPFEPIVPEGLHLGASREHDGAVTGHLFDEENKLQGHAAWEWVDEPIEVDTSPYESPSRELTPEERELIEQVTALMLALIVIGVQAAAPHVRRWWSDVARPGMKRAWSRVARRNRPVELGPIASEILEIVEEAIEDVKPGTELAHTRPEYTMSSAEWSERYAAMMAAARFGEEQALILQSARIVDAATPIDADGSAELSLPEFANRVRGMLATSPESLSDETLTNLRILLEQQIKKR